MALRVEPLPSFTGVAAGQDALCHLPSGIKIHEIGVIATEATNSLTVQGGNLLGDITVIVANKVQRQLSAVQLNHIQSMNDANEAAKTAGVNGQAGYQNLLPIYFADPSRKNGTETRGAAWDLNGPGVTGLDLKVRVQAGVNTPVLSGYYAFEDSTAPLGLIVKMTRGVYGAVGTIVEDNKLPLTELWQAMHLFPSADNKYVTQLDFQVDSIYYRKETTQFVNACKLIGRGLNPDVTVQYPVYDCVFDYDDPVDEWLQMEGRAKARFKATLSAAAANNMEVIFVTVGPRN